MLFFLFLLLTVKVKSQKNDQNLIHSEKISKQNIQHAARLNRRPDSSHKKSRTTLPSSDLSTVAKAGNQHMIEIDQPRKKTLKEKTRHDLYKSFHSFPLLNHTVIIKRNELGSFLERNGFKTGAELGVQKALFSRTILTDWKSCEKYILVDSWQHTVGYADSANIPQDQQDKVFNMAKAELEPWKSKTIFLRNYTTDAIAYVANASLDFIYVDARHDYCGVLQDLEAWWPKLKQNGIMAGHDFITGYQQLSLRLSWKDGMLGYSKSDDYTLCYDGNNVHEGAVKVAAIDFALRNNLQVFTTYADMPQIPNFIFSPKDSTSTNALLESQQHAYKLMMVLEQQQQQQQDQQEAIEKECSYHYKLTALNGRSDLGLVAWERNLTTGAILGESVLSPKLFLKSWSDKAQKLFVVVPDLTSSAQSILRNSIVSEDRLPSLSLKFPQSVHDVPDSSLDFIYLGIEREYSYCGMASRLAMWWPKLRSSIFPCDYLYHSPYTPDCNLFHFVLGPFLLRAQGLMSGYNFLSAFKRLKTQVLKGEYKKPYTNWALCEDGQTRHEGAARAAVMDFAVNHTLALFTIPAGSDVGSVPSWIFSAKQ